MDTQLQIIMRKVISLSSSVSELSRDCSRLHMETNNPHTENVTDYLRNELAIIADELYRLSETRLTEDYSPDLECESVEDAEEVMDWWDGLDLADKCDIANIPTPSSNDGRGDEHYYAEERADKWWYSRTYEQKMKAYEEYQL